MMVTRKHLLILAWIAGLLALPGLVQLARVVTGAADVSNATLSIDLRSTHPDPGSAYNGEPITFTLAITNSGTQPITQLRIIENLPKSALDNIQCITPCTLAAIISNIPEPLGGSIQISTVTGMNWSIASPLNQGESVRVSFAGRVAGQIEGSVLGFDHDAQFSQAGSPGSAASSTQVQVHLRVSQAGQASISSAPSWLSADAGGTISQDWGDFDRDGDLDLALGSSQQATIYRNDGGRLQELWKDPENKKAYGVRWADVDGDGALDLVVVGASLDGTPVTAGRNYVYKVNGSVVSQFSTFTSTRQLVRLALADVNGDGLVDLIASTNLINAGDTGFCGVVMYINTGGVFGPEVCLFHRATAALALADVNNDGRVDLVVGQFPNQILVGLNGREPITPTFTNTVILEKSVPFLAYDFSFGDYDADGFLDIAAAYPLLREARVYHNASGSGTPGFDGIKVIKTSTFLTPLSLDWGFFSGSGRLELAVADERPKVYRFANGNFSAIEQFTLPTVGGQQWSTRGVQLQRSTDIDLSISNRDKASQLNSALAPHLASGNGMLKLDNSPASAVAWGDRNGDGLQDLTFGAGDQPGLGARVYLNALNGFSTRTNVEGGLGPQTVALGDVNGDGKLDTVIANSSGSRSVRVYLNGSPLNGEDWSVNLSGGRHVAALGDANADGRLDVLVSSEGGGLRLYLNAGSVPSTTAVWVSPVISSVRAIAWMDYDEDGYQDIAIANYGVGAQIYHNNKDNTFSLVWTSKNCATATSVAWSDVNSDGWLDLAVGCHGLPSQIYLNKTASVSTQPDWVSTTFSKTTAIAFGDWDNDGWAELALANDGEAAQVFSNDTPHDTPGIAPTMNWNWSSDEKYSFTGVAWGDFNGDGYLDLALSSNSGSGTQWSGVYTNTTVIPTHANANFARGLVLPTNPPYVSVPRPGTTSDAFLFSSSEMVATSKTPTVTIRYKAYDGNGTRNETVQNAQGITIANTLFEFSMDDGSNWHTATPSGTGNVLITTTRLGREGFFIWDAQKDQAVSYNARFRVTVVQDNLAGPVHSAEGSAISPPFQVQATTCELPFGAGIYVGIFPEGQTRFEANDAVLFTGFVLKGSGDTKFSWEFGHGNPVAIGVGQVITHAFPDSGTYLVRLTVTGELCPITREAVFAKTMAIGNGVPRKHIYLPAVSGPVTGGGQ